jgi:hypothetical protein
VKRSVACKAAVVACLGAIVSTVAIAGKPVKAPTVEGMGVFAAGQLIGKLLDLPEGTPWSYVISPKGYAFRIYQDKGGEQPIGALGANQNNLFFAGTGCTGDAYSDSDSVWLLAQGLVFAAPSFLPYSAYYYPRGSQTELRNFASYSQGMPNSTCTDQSGTLQLITIHPNDSAVTGVPDGPFALPITFGMP